jgi:dienelactone hydrolase
MTLEPLGAKLVLSHGHLPRTTTASAKRTTYVSLSATLSLALFSTLAHADVLLQENFDSSLGQFTSVGSVAVTTSGARMAGSFGGTDGAITSPAISTVGFTALSLSYSRTTTGLDSGEAGFLEYSTNGSTYTSLGSTQSASGPVTVALPAAAENQAGLRLRWRVNASSSTEYYTVDTIVLQGTGGPVGCEPNCPPTGNPYQRGPAPSATSLDGATGPFTVATSVVSSTAASGYGGGTIYYPTNTTEGPFAAIAVVPGYLSPQSSIQQWGPRLASWGFVAITIATNSTSDQPASRATQLVAALDQVVSYSNSTTHVIRGKVDPTRLGVAGWSMGGGGTLIALDRNPTKLKAGMGFAPWNSSTNFSGVNQPALLFACENDSTAPPASHAYPFYNSMPNTNDKAFAEVNGGSHSCANDPRNNSGRLGRYGVSWMKRFLDNDTRFTDFLCGAPHNSIVTGTTTFSRYLSTCPY